jgi:putative aldouronate transport system permease protein
MIAKRTRSEQVVYVLIILFMIALMIVTLYPFLYVVFASLSNPGDLMRTSGPILSPVGSATLAAYQAVMDNPMILTGYRNTLFYVIAGTALNMVLTVLGAYCLSRKNVMFKNWIMLGIVFTMFFQGGLIPSYVLVSQTLNLQDNPLALIFPGAIATINLIILKTAFETVPVALEEAARIDGANDWHVLWNIIIPMSLPAMAVITLFYAVGQWNAWFGAMLYLRNRELYPLQLILREILISNSTATMTSGASAGDVMPLGETIKYATIVVATLPVLCIYPFLQRYFVKGVMIGAIKE